MRMSLVLWMIIWVMALFVGFAIGSFRSNSIDVQSTNKYLEIIESYKETIKTYQRTIATYDKIILDYQAIIKRLEALVKSR